MASVPGQVSRRKSSGRVAAPPLHRRRTDTGSVVRKESEKAFVPAAAFVPWETRRSSTKSPECRFFRGAEYWLPPVVEINLRSSTWIGADFRRPTGVLESEISKRREMISAFARLVLENSRRSSRWWNPVSPSCERSRGTAMNVWRVPGRSNCQLSRQRVWKELVCRVSQNISKAAWAKAIIAGVRNADLNFIDSQVLGEVRGSGTEP